MLAAVMEWAETEIGIMQNNALNDKVALVTGGARRLGAAVARELHRCGMRLVLHYRSSDSDAHALQRELLAARPDSVLLVKGDLLDTHKIDNLVLETANAFGRLDALVNSASTFYPTPLGETTEEQWTDLFGTNLKAPYFLVQEAAPLLRAAHGCVVNMVDVYAWHPLPAFPVYTTAKAGLIALTRALARELAPEVRVNAVAPGAILWAEGDTDQVTQQRVISRTPLKRTGTPEEIARAVLFLVRDATFTTGQVLAVDGGRSING
jgi:pteridine reductase